MAVAYFRKEDSTNWASAYSNQAFTGSVTLGTNSGRCRMTRASGTTANTLNAIAWPTNPSEATTNMTDGEIAITWFAPSAAGIMNGVCCRMKNTGGVQWNGYVLKETTAGDPTSYTLWVYKDENPETLVQVGEPIATGVASYTNGLRCRFAYIGAHFYMKFWAANGAEPADSTFVHRTDSMIGSAGRCGPIAWGLDAASEYTEFDNIHWASWGTPVRDSNSPASAVNTTDGTTMTFSFSGLANTVGYLCVRMSTNTGACPAMTAPTCTGVTFGTVRNGATYASSNHRVALVAYQIGSSDVSAATLTLNWDASTTMTAAGIGYASFSGTTYDLLNVFGSALWMDTADSGSAVTSLDVTPTSIGNVTTFSGLTVSNGWLSLATHAANETCNADGNADASATTANATPSHGHIVQWFDAFEATISASWTTSARARAATAEIIAADPGTEYPDFSAVPGVRPRRFTNIALVR